MYLFNNDDENIIVRKNLSIGLDVAVRTVTQITTMYTNSPGQVGDWPFVSILYS